MRRIFSLVALLAGLALLPGPAAAQPVCSGRDMMAELATTDAAAHAGITERAHRTENARHLLWTIEKPGVATSYLFGTVHLSDPRVTTLSPAVTRALGTARRVALEVEDPSGKAMGEALGAVMPLLLDPSGSGLDKALPPDDLVKVRAALEGAGLPYQIIGMVRPWFVYTLLSLPACERARTAGGLLNLDRSIAKLAQDRGLPVVGLETIEDQLKALASLPREEQLNLLKLSLKLHDRIDDVTETLVLLYTRRQLGAVWPLNLHLAKSAGVPASAFDGFQSQILVQRNRRMAEALLPLLAEGGVFAGVGALHLVDTEGLVSLLRAAGYTLTPIE